MSKDDALIAVRKLVEQFNEQYKSYHDSSYDEHKTRLAFINPFFTALGWDVENKEGVYEAYREVIPEDKQKVGGSTKAPDYGFRLQGSARRLFFVEAKKPSVPIKTDKHSAYQLRRYGRSAGTSISVLTNFKEFAVYDCSKKPKLTDSAAIARIKYLTYDQYPHLFDFLWDTFSREAVVKGRFLKFVESDTGKRGSIPLDKEFVASLDTWRKYLATSIAKNNPRITDEELGFAVQQTIDRLIFLRFCEDRAVEHYGMLKHTYERGDYYKNLLHEFEKAHDKYNSGLFDLKKDRITPALKVDNKVVRSIIEELYYPRCEYEFSVMPVEIMGNAYEQFLGKVIRVTPGHIVKIEEKPEVRKAGGVYYTPQYIVDYIVKNTVGNLIEGKSPKEIEKIKIVDPACGSGSFLLGAFQFLADYHQRYYLEKKKTSGKLGDVLTPEGRLTTAEKRKILLNNIHGVDIDSNAVEVTKLSLMLKAMEGETDASIQQQLKLFHQRVLPDLDKNIVCGNSLISPDFFDGQLQVDPDERKELEKKIKPFDWKSAFPQILKQGGFDAVIGNPPYRLMQPKEVEEPILNYFRNNYSVAEFKLDLFHLFFQKGIRALNNEGLLGFITPSSLLNNVYAERLREWILNNCRVDIIAISREKVFADADVFTSVFVFEREDNLQKANKHVIKTTLELDKVKSGETPQYKTVKQQRFKETEGKVWNILINEDNISLINKITANTVRLNSISQINRGLITGDRDKYFSLNRVNEKYKPILAGSDVLRYFNVPVSKYILFKRPDTAGGCWDENVHFAQHKILIRQIGTTPTATIIEKPIAVTGNIFTVIANSLEDEKFILALINSKVIAFYWKIMFSDYKSSFPQVTIFSLNSLPIKINAEKSLRHQIVSYVDTMLQLHKDLQQAKLPTEKESIQNRIAYTDRTIDVLVYKLYGLTEEEIAIIERE